LGQALSGGGLADCFDLMAVHLGLRVRVLRGFTLLYLQSSISYRF
jgi:hypothetical protein